MLCLVPDLALPRPYHDRAFLTFSVGDMYFLGDDELTGELAGVFWIMLSMGVFIYFYYFNLKLFMPFEAVNIFQLSVFQVTTSPSHPLPDPSPTECMNSTLCPPGNNPHPLTLSLTLAQLNV